MLTNDEIEQMKGVVRKCIYGIPDSEGQVARDTLDKIVAELLTLREAVAPQMEDVESHAEDIKTWIGRQPSGITELSYEREAHTTLKYLTDLARQAILSAEREKQRADDAERRMVLLETEDRSNAAMSDRCNRVLRVLRDSGNADAESAFWIIAGDARESREKTNTLTAHLSAIRDAGDEEVDAAKQDCINLLIKIVLARGIEQESRPPHPNPVPSYQQLRERIYKLYDIAIARGQQLREAREEIERLDQVVQKLKDNFGEMEVGP